MHQLQVPQYRAIFCHRSAVSPTVILRLLCNAFTFGVQVLSFYGRIYLVLYEVIWGSYRRRISMSWKINRIYFRVYDSTDFFYACRELGIEKIHKYKHQISLTLLNKFFILSGNCLLSILLSTWSRVYSRAKRLY
jgi:hypothetical protein